ncbi:hypothetical protein Tco_0446306 [Tanacetum coccineum]
MQENNQKIKKRIFECLSNWIRLTRHSQTDFPQLDSGLDVPTFQQGEGHMARQCTQPKRPRNAAWFKEKLMLAEAQEAGQILDEEQLAFLEFSFPD